MKRRVFIRLIGGLAIALPLASYAQEPKQPPKRVGVLVEAPCPPKLTTGWSDGPWFKRLSELGWIEGQTFIFDCVSTAGHQIPALARELVSRRPDVLTAGLELHKCAKAGDDDHPDCHALYMGARAVGSNNQLRTARRECNGSCLVQLNPQGHGNPERDCSKSEASRIHSWGCGTGRPAFRRVQDRRRESAIGGKRAWIYVADF